MLSRFFSMEIIVTILVLVAVVIAWMDRSGYYVRISWLEATDDFLNASDLLESGSGDESLLEF
jgi:hypothetical protein